ncbi:rare lipoprotein A [Neisseria bacilliformis ATCC BAA-1200]|uniref:Rare lipoprotein A n=1 Tax=Neisseria bacilliformis ATCC BAA-1200 TaxID=888742 RepID=F2B8Y1_9NEIS|nr:rare lipoprotein A [Neisseria bacilliformis ATCC BAA-1200]
MPQGVLEKNFLNYTSIFLFPNRWLIASRFVLGLAEWLGSWV